MEKIIETIRNIYPYLGFWYPVNRQSHHGSNGIIFWTCIRTSNDLKPAHVLNKLQKIHFYFKRKRGEKAHYELLKMFDDGKQVGNFKSKEEFIEWSKQQQSF